MINKQGMTLVQLLVGVVISVTVAFIIARTFKSMVGFEKQASDEARVSQEARGLGLFLKAKLEGSRNFQNVSFRVPVQDLYSEGAGFIIEPDVDFFGNASMGNDRIFILLQSPLPTSVRLESAFPGPALQVKSSDNAKSISDLFSVGDGMVLTTIQYAEVLKIIATPSNAPSSDITIAEGQGSFDFTFADTGTPTGLRRSYLSGDFVYKAQVIVVGLDTAKKELLTGIYAQSSPTTIAQLVDSFSVNYNLGAPEGKCPTVTTAADEFLRNHWVALNGDRRCYSRIARIRFNYSVSEKPFDYTFIVNQ